MIPEAELEGRTQEFTISRLENGFSETAGL